MPKYTVQDTTSGKTVTFEWNGTGEPTESDMEEVFQGAGLRGQEQSQAEQPMGFKKIGQIMSSGATPLRHALYGGEGLDASGRVVEGLNAVARMISAPFNLGIEGLKQVPYVGKVAAFPYEAPGKIANKAWQAISPSVLPEDMTPQKKSAINELVPTLGTIALLKGAQSAPKIAGKTVGGISRKVLPQPERVYSVGAKLGGIGKEAEAATYGVKNRVQIGGSYKFQPKNYAANQAKIKNLVETKLKPEIEAIQETGVSLQRAQVLKEVNEYLRDNFAGLKTPAGKARYQKALESLNEEFKQGSEKITPKEMQEGKTATHREATYDAEGQITNEFNKAVAHIYRKKLEEWNPNLADINKELLNLDILGESIYNEAMRSSKNLPKGEGSLPFYIAIANPVKGGAIGGARALMSGASPLSKTSFLIDRLQQMGKKTTDATNVSQPLNVPPTPKNTPQYDPQFYSKVDVARAQNPVKGAPVIPPDVQYIGMQGDMPLFQYKNIGSFSVPKGMTFQQAFENFKSRFSL